MKNKNTKLLMRVFFVIAILSLFGIIWQWQKNTTEKIKVVGGSFTEGIIGTPRFINPVLAQSNSDKDLTQLLFSSLINKEKNGTYSLKLAESIKISENKKIYTLKIKDNLLFHDGKPINIDDVIFTIKKIQDPAIKSPLQNKWEGVAVEKIDDFSAKFIITQEYSDFIYNFTIGILPKHIWKDIKSEEFIFNQYNTIPIGSGDYKVEKIKYKKTGIPESYKLKRIKKSDTYIETINLFFYENEIDLIKAYRKGIIDAAYGLSPVQENHDLFENDYGTTGKLPRVFGLFFNQNKQPLLKDKNIRQLINLSINREEIVNDIFSGYAYPINSPLGNEIKDGNYDTEKIQNTLKEKGWEKDSNGIYNKKDDKGLLKLSLNLSTPNVPELVSLADKIKDELYQNGIEIKIHIFEEANLHQKIIRPRDYEILLFGYMIEKQTDIYAFWHSSQKNDPGLNISLYNNKDVDKELEKLRKEKKSADMHIVENEIMDDIPAVFVYSPAYTYLLPKKIKGESILLSEKHERFSHINEWYIRTRSIWNIFKK